MSFKRRTFIALAATVALLGLPLAGAGVRAQAAGRLPPELARRWPAARLHGEGRLRFLGLSVYDIRLWTPADAPDAVGALASRWAETPLALELQYARRLVGRLIAERSIQEMQRQAELPPARAQDWEAEMARLFPDVADGDRLTGVQLPGEGARFYFNGELRGELRDPDFARLFFGIWLAPQTSEPTLRERLLGQGGR
jgi:hypothetical protein